MSLESPCVKVCTMDGASGYCVGCLRTLDEIANWAAFSDEQRREIRAALPARRRHAGFSVAPSPPPQWIGKRCERCGEGFGCGAASPERPCWCASYPSVPPTAGDCLCPACLASSRA